MQFLKRHIEIILILLVGLILRFTIATTHSYSNDELSAVNRLQFDNFSDLIEFGVMRGDMHPAGVQVFMKAWSQVAGLNESGMRFPFVIFGLISILLVYLIGKEWLSKKAGIIAAIFLAALYFPVMNSEFARPYSPGLMFCLMAGWFYLKILFSDKRTYLMAVLLGLSFAGAMYSHYFAFMFIAWMGVSSLIFANKNNIFHILIAGALSIALFVPHISVTQFHLDVGGLQWLGPPDANWLLQFLFHSFNDSMLLVIGVVSLLVFSFVFREKINLSDKRQLIICAIWFFGIYVVGHLYSVLSTPVLKFPVMLFALPFFLLIIGHFLAQFMFQRVMYGLLIIMVSMSTIFEKDLFGNMHYELFSEISDDILSWEDEYGQENIYTVYNLNNPNYMNFYANQKDRTIDFDWDVIEFGDAAEIREDLKSTSEEYCIVGFSARLTLVQVFESCKEFYPNIIAGHKYNNSSVYLLSKNEESKIEQSSELISAFKPGHLKHSWICNDNQFVSRFDSISNQIKKQYVLNENREYGPDFIFRLLNVQDYKKKYFKVIVNADIEEQGQLTASFTVKRKGEILQYRNENFWEGRDLENMIKETGEGYFTFKIPDFILPTDDLMISLWNRNPDSPIYINHIEFLSIENIWN